MVKILNTTKGWCYQSNTEVAYYKTLHEVMAAAYAKEYPSRSNEGSIQRDSKGNYQGSG